MCRCQDYILINSESFGTQKICGNLSSNNELSGILSSSIRMLFFAPVKDRALPDFLCWFSVYHENVFSMVFDVLLFGNLHNQSIHTVCQGTSDILLNCFCECTTCPEEILNASAVQGISNPACCYVVHV